MASTPKRHAVTGHPSVSYEEDVQSQSGMAEMVEIARYDVRHLDVVTIVPVLVGGQSSGVSVSAAVEEFESLGLGDGRLQWYGYRGITVSKNNNNPFENVVRIRPKREGITAVRIRAETKAGELRVYYRGYV